MEDKLVIPFPRRAYEPNVTQPRLRRERKPAEQIESELITQTKELNLNIEHLLT